MKRESSRIDNEASEYDTLKARPRRKGTEEDDLDTVETDIDSFFDGGDEHPGDRRKDPLRRGW